MPEEAKKRRSFLDPAEETPGEQGAAPEEEDDGAHIRNLIIALEEAVARDKRGRRCAVRHSFVEEREHSAAHSLLKCLEKVREMNSKSKMQYRLQDMILEWLMAPTESYEPPLINIQGKVDERKRFWGPFRSNCLKWELSSDEVKELGSKKQKKSFATLHCLREDQLPKVKTNQLSKQHRHRGNIMGGANVGEFSKALQPLDPYDRSDDPVVPNRCHNHTDCNMVSIQNKDVACCKMCRATTRCFVKGHDVQPRWRRKKERRSAPEEPPDEYEDRVEDDALRRSFYETEPLILGETSKKEKGAVLFIDDIDDIDRIAPHRDSFPSLREGIGKTCSLPSLHEHGSQTNPHNEDSIKQKKLKKLSVPKIKTRFPGLYDPVRSMSHARSPQQKYFAACAKQHMLPRVPACLLGGLVSRTISLQHQSLLDDDLEALTAPLQKGNIEVLDLSHNRFTDDCMSDFLGELHAEFLKYLDISFTGVAGYAVDQISTMLCTGCPRLQELRLGGITLSDSACSSLCDAIAEHGQITDLGLQDSNLGRMNQRCIVKVANLIVKLTVLKKLDLSGNFIFHEGFEALVDALAQTESLYDLDLSHNASSYIVPPKKRTRVSKGDAKPGKKAEFVLEEVPNFNPILLLCEGLGRNRTLYKLGMASCMLDFSADFVLAVSLEGHPKLEYLDLSNNPHGENGLRALLRLLMPPKCRIVYCNIADCRDSRTVGLEHGIDFTEPRGHYELNLRHPQHRCIARFLLERAARESDPIDSYFEKLEMKDQSADKKKGDKQWYWKEGRHFNLASVGKITFDFTASTTIDKELKPDDALRQYNRNRRVAITMGRFVTLFAMYHNLRSAEQRTLLIGAMHDQLLFKMCHFQKFLAVSPDLVEVIVMRLYAAVESMDRMALFDLLKRKDESKRFRKVARSHFFFNELNCTDHYEIDLSSPTDRVVAERVTVMNAYERLTRGAIDNTQHGGGEGVRNATWEGSFEIKNFSSYTLPPRGLLALDYVSPRGPSNRTMPCSDQCFEKIIEIYGTSECCHEDRVRALRCVAHQLVLTKDQLLGLCKNAHDPSHRNSTARMSMEARLSLRGKIIRAAGKLKAMNVLGIQVKDSAFGYRDVNPRVEMFICFFNRCMDQPDICSKYCLYDEALFTKPCQKEIKHRLGVLRTFDALDCHREDSNVGNRYKLKLHVHEEWCLAKFLVLLAAIEDGENMIKCEYSECAFMTRQGYDFLVPVSWVKELPTEGTFTTTYVEEKPEYRLVNERRRLAEEICGWEKQ